MGQRSPFARDREDLWKLLPEQAVSARNPHIHRGLKPAPCTLHPEPGTPNPEPWTRNSSL